MVPPSRGRRRGVVGAATGRGGRGGAVEYGFGSVRRSPLVSAAVVHVCLASVLVLVGVVVAIVFLVVPGSILALRSRPFRLGVSFCGVALEDLARDGLGGVGEVLSQHPIQESGF